MAEILIIESNERAAQQMESMLTRAGHGCHTVENAGQAKISLKNIAYALTIMNARLPWADSFSFMEGLSQKGWPVLFTTCEADTKEHLQTMYGGPSRVLIQPFSAEELLEQVNSLIQETEKRLAIGNLEIHLEEKAVLLDGEPLSLTAQEFALLQVLMQNPDTALSREQLLRTAWGYQNMGETRTVDVHVQRLRKKLGEDCIETVYKLGYRLRMA